MVVPTEEERRGALRRKGEADKRDEWPHNRRPIDTSLSDLAHRRKRRKGAEAGRRMLQSLNSQ